MSYSGLGTSSPPLCSTGPLGGFVAGWSLNSDITYFLSFLRQPVPAPPPGPLGILRLDGPVFRPLGASPAGGQAPLFTDPQGPWLQTEQKNWISSG